MQGDQLSLAAQRKKRGKLNLFGLLFCSTVRGQSRLFACFSLSLSLSSPPISQPFFNRGGRSRPRAKMGRHEQPSPNRSFLRSDLPEPERKNPTWAFRPRSGVGWLVSFWVPREKAVGWQSLTKKKKFFFPECDFFSRVPVSITKGEAFFCFAPRFPKNQRCKSVQAGKDIGRYFTHARTRQK